MRSRPLAATRIGTVCGHEGGAAAHYFEGLRSLLVESVPAELRWATRNRRPPLDRFNSLLSFGYGLLHTAVMRAVLASGLEPALGFFHTPRSAAYPLVLDLMELFRMPLWDLVVIGAQPRPVGPRSGLRRDAHQGLAVRGGPQESDRPVRGAPGRNLEAPRGELFIELRAMLELEARLLEKEWTGEPGLFAQARLR